MVLTVDKQRVPAKKHSYDYLDTTYEIISDCKHFYNYERLVTNRCAQSPLCTAVVVLSGLVDVLGRESRCAWSGKLFCTVGKAYHVKSILRK